MFHNALTLERNHGLNFFDQVAPAIRGQGMSLAGPDGSRALNWIGDWDGGPAQSVDQRVKMAVWLELFEERGGKVVIHGATTADLNGLAALYDLVIVAAGKGEIAQLFDRDTERSVHSTPQRTVAATYVHGVEFRPERPGPDVWMNMVPGVGELINIPGYTKSGACDILYLSAIPGGPFDIFGDRPAADEQLRRQLELFQQYLPWEYERCRNAELTDSRGVLSGAVTPTVRKPVGRLPSGAYVLGMADVVVINDPVTGQGSNSAAKCAESYLNSILERGEKPFDPEWMEATFERFWEYAQYVVKITTALLAPPPPHVQEALGAGQTNEKVAKAFANGFNHPPLFEEWIYDPEKTRAFIAS
ncbi:styrene monooxygenase/indole monooxygenase family protein, partial [Amycolatopsis pigmentata]